MSKRAKRAPFTILDREVAAGSTATLELPIADLYTHTTMTMPVRVLHSRKPGPVLFIAAAIHGDEINGVEIIRRLLKSPSLKSLRGTLLLTPVVNVFGFTDQTRYLPDRRDLNRCFPGSERGSQSSRLAGTFMDEIVRRSAYGIDLHTGSLYRSNLPQIRACLDDEEIDRISRVFGVPVILDAPLREGSLREAGQEAGTRILVYETGGAMAFDELGIRTGVKGIIQVMRVIGMLPPRNPGKRKVKTFVARSSVWTRAPQGGILSSRVKLGQEVNEGEVLGKVSDIFGDYEMDVVSNTAGIIIGAVTLPLVNEGAALYHIARFRDSEKVAASVDAMREEMFGPLDDQEESLMDEE